MKKQTLSTFSLTVLTSAILAAFNPVQAAEDDELAAITKPGSTLSIGAGYVTDDNRRFGQYTGLHDDGPYVLFDLDFVRRDEATGTWLKLSTRNLGLDTRELRFEHNRQGDWGYFLEYNQIPRFEPYKVNTGLIGIGTSSLTRVALPTEGAGSNHDFETMRKIISVGASKGLPAGFDFEIRFRNEEKDGERLFGTAGWVSALCATCTGLSFLAEPIDSTTRQWETFLSFTGERLQLAAGYNGSSYENEFKSIIVDGITNGTSSQFSPVGLPPDNQSHQLYLSGGYQFTPTTRGTFKVSYARTTQDETFIPVTRAAGTPNSLDGRIDVTLAQLGLTARPTPDLSLLANLRYLDQEDKTPIFVYFSGAGPTSTNNGQNEPRSVKEALVGKLEASYRLPMGFRLTGSIDHEARERNVSAVRVVSARDETNETSYRIELRRSLSEVINGSLSYVHSKRDGSDFLTTTLVNGASGSNLVAPVFLADRDRDKVRLTLDWMPTDRLSLQFAGDFARDDYAQRTALGLGPRKGDWRFLSVDASYTLSPDWQFTAFASHDRTSAEQASCTGAVGANPTCLTAPETPWQSELRNSGNAFGIGLRGKPREKVEVGADLQYSHDRGEFDQSRIAGAAAVPVIPDINYKQTTIKLFAKYALQKNSGVRADYIYNRFKTDDWYWKDSVLPLFSDRTTMLEDENQSVNFVGLSYYYSWR